MPNDKLKTKLDLTQLRIKLQMLALKIEQAESQEDKGSAKIVLPEPVSVEIRNLGRDMERF